MIFQINKLLLYLLLTFFITTTSYGCALCQMQIPKVDVELKITKLTDKTHFDIAWNFHKRFVAQLSMYDQNENGKLDPKEQDAITNALETYIDKLNYLTQMRYSKRGFKSDKVVKIKPLSTKMVFKNGLMSYHFNFDTNFVLQNDHTLTIQFKDEQQNFNFLIKDIILKKYHDKYFIKPLEHYAKITFNDPTILATQPVQKNISKNIDKNISITTKQIQLTPIKSDSYLQELSKQLKIYKEKMKTLLNDIKQNNSASSYLWLLFFSLIYGILHALGPGHGKTLVASYFLSENRSISKAFYISLLIGVVHTFSAFLLTLFIYLVLKLLFISFITDIDFVATKISALLIIAIALYLLFKKYKSTKKTKSQMTFSVHNPNASSCGCSSCNTKSEDIGVILAAGIVPCPGTVTIWVYFWTWYLLCRFFKCYFYEFRDEFNNIYHCIS